MCPEVLQLLTSHHLNQGNVLLCHKYLLKQVVASLLILRGRDTSPVFWQENSFMTATTTTTTKE